MDAQLDTGPEARTQLPLSAKIAAIYLIIAGITSIPLLFGPQSAEFLALPPAGRAGHYTREIMLDLAFIVAGVAVLRRRSWARKLGVTVLVISAINGTFAFAHGFALISFVVLGAWNTLWIYLLCRKPRPAATPDA